MVTTMLTAMSFSASADDIVANIYASDTDDRSTATVAVEGGVTAGNLASAIQAQADAGKFVWVEFTVTELSLGGTNVAAKDGKKIYITTAANIEKTKLDFGGDVITVANQPTGEVVFKNIEMTSSSYTLYVNGSSNGGGTVTLLNTTVTSAGGIYGALLFEGGGGTALIGEGTVITGTKHGINVNTKSAVTIKGIGITDAAKCGVINNTAPSADYEAAIYVNGSQRPCEKLTIGGTTLAETIKVEGKKAGFFDNSGASKVIIEKTATVTSTGSAGVQLYAGSDTTIRGTVSGNGVAVKPYNGDSTGPIKFDGATILGQVELYSKKVDIINTSIIGGTNNLLYIRNDAAITLIDNSTIENNGGSNAVKIRGTATVQNGSTIKTTNGDWHLGAGVVVEGGTFTLKGNSSIIGGGRGRNNGDQGVLEAYAGKVIIESGSSVTSNKGIAANIYAAASIANAGTLKTEGGNAALSVKGTANIITGADIEGEVIKADSATVKENIVAFDGTNYLDNAGLVAALKGATGDLTVELLADFTASKNIIMKQNITINGNGKTIIIGEYGNIFRMEATGKTLTINNATITGDAKGSDTSSCIFQIKNAGHLTLKDVTMKNLNAKWYIINLMDNTGAVQNVVLDNVTATEGIGANGFFSTGNAGTSLTDTNNHYMHAVITIKNSNIAHSKLAFQVNKGSTAAITIENSTITSAKQFTVVAPEFIKGDAAKDSTIAINGDFTMTGGTSIVGVVTINSGKLTINGASITSPKSGVVIVKAGTELEMTAGLIESTTASNAINLAGKATISGGTVKNANGKRVIRLDDGGELYISGGEFISGTAAEKYIIQRDNANDTLCKVIITGGTFTGGIDVKGNTILSIENAAFDCNRIAHACTSELVIKNSNIKGQVATDSTKVTVIGSTITAGVGDTLLVAGKNPTVLIDSSTIECTAGSNTLQINGGTYTIQNGSTIKTANSQWAGGAAIRVNSGNVIIKGSTVIGGDRGNGNQLGLLEIRGGSATVDAASTVIAREGTPVSVYEGATLDFKGTVSTDGAMGFNIAGTAVISDTTIGETVYVGGANANATLNNITATAPVNVAAGTATLNGGTYTASATVFTVAEGAKLNLNVITVYSIENDADGSWAYSGAGTITANSVVYAIANPDGINGTTGGQFKLEEAEASVVIGGVRYYIYTDAKGGPILMDSGASIKISGNANGLRFTSFLSKKTVDGIEGTDVEFGTYIIPTHLIAEAGLDTFDVEALRAAGYKVLKVKAETSLNNEITNEAGEVLGYSIRAAITNIKEAHLNWEYSAITYITYKDAEGNVHTIYGNYSEADNSRSITAVAVAAYADVKAPDAEGYDASVYVYAVGDGTYSPYTTAQREAIKVFADKYVAD